MDRFFVPTAIVVARRAQPPSRPAVAFPVRRAAALPGRALTAASTAPYVDGPSVARVFAGACDRIACDHMSGLFLRSRKTAGPDGVRDARSKHIGDVEHQWVPRSVSRLGIDRSHHLLLQAFRPSRQVMPTHR